MNKEDLRLDVAMASIEQDEAELRDLIVRIPVSLTRELDDTVRALAKAAGENTATFKETVMAQCVWIAWRKAMRSAHDSLLEKIEEGP